MEPGPAYLATYRAFARASPQEAPADLLEDLVTSTPGDEGTWFATAMDAGLIDEAIRLANLRPCDPRTLTRAARDFADEHPAFAVEAGMAALRWLVAGHAAEVRERVREIVASEPPGDRFVTRMLGRELGL